MIVNVLKMMNAPTKSATNAKTSSAVWKNPSAWLRSSASCAAAEATVMA
jgi:hypothetical protein